MIIVPYLLMGPGLFTGAMTLGVLTKHLVLLEKYKVVFHYFAKLTRITELRSIHKRLMEFEEVITKNKLRNLEI